MKICHSQKKDIAKEIIGEVSKKRPDAYKEEGGKD